MPQHGEPGQPDFETGFTTDKPRDVEPAIPPYEGRKTVADSGETGAKIGARTGGATAPTTDPDFKSPAPEDTPGGATTSPAHEQPASGGSETDRDDEWLGLRTRRAPVAANRDASDSPLVPRDVDVGAQPPPHVPLFHAVFDA